ncbi:MAG: C4-dicarboxylate ABC transporter substrate-binding protein [Oceanospirillum sp.]|nr:C4-dicarboxylate ABC transporter substrate-binding protein [Oceanospirillum sp.]
MTLKLSILLQSRKQLWRSKQSKCNQKVFGPLGKILTHCLVAYFLSFSVAVSHGDSSFITIGTGDITGVYYPAGGAICRLINEEKEQHDLRCAVESTEGSAYNLFSLRRNEFDLAIVQADWLYHASRGSSIFSENGADDSLRLLFNLHSESFTVVARKDSEINSFSDLKGKRVNIGSPSSGHRKTMELIMRRIGWSEKDFALATELPPSEMAAALCNGAIDAFIYMVGHPNTSIREATTFCDSQLVPLPGKLIQSFTEQYPFYQSAEIAGGMYRGTDKDISTFQVRASVVTNTSLSTEQGFQITRSVFAHLDQFKALHPALRSLDWSIMVPDKMPLVPLHPGAKKFFTHDE